MIHKCLILVVTIASLTFSQHAAWAEPPRDGGGEFAAEHQALVEATAALFERIEASSAPKTHGLKVGSIRSVRSRTSSSKNDTENLTRMGPVAHLTGYRVTWYPMERLHGTVDFMGTWNGNRNLVCGYVTWDLTNPDAPELESLDASFVDLGAFSGVSETNVHRDLIEANCAYGAIEANYRVFDPTG